MARSGEWLIPHLETSRHTQPRVWLEKPPLVFWLQAAVMSVLGVTEFAARLPSALAGVATGVVVYQMGRKKSGWHVGVLAGLLVLVYPPVLLNDHSAQTADTDMIFTFFGTLFLWWLWRAQERPEWLIPSAVAAALAVLSKGFAAGIFLPIAAVIVATDWRSYLTRWAPVAAASGIGIIGSWFGYAYLQYPDTLINQMVLSQVVDRATGELATSNTALFGFMNYPYFRDLPGYLAPGDWWPLFALFVLGLIVATRDAYRDDNRHRNIILFSWAAVIPVGFAVLGGTYIHYLLPMVIPATILTALALAPVIHRIRRLLSKQSKLQFDAAYLVCGLLVVSAVWAIYPLPTTINERDVGQRQVGETFDSAPADATVHIQTDVEEWTYSLWFYVDRDMAATSVSNISRNHSIQYAVVEEGNLTQLNREYTVIKNPKGSELVAIRFATAHSPPDHVTVDRSPRHATGSVSVPPFALFTSPDLPS
jgi:4-amino-4-deoxy-L-arabinose transferase-like glycosyltransferase